jgi:uncharacterized protein YhbP (UPF0306 family)
MMLDTRVHELIQLSTMALATGLNQSPHVAPVFFVADSEYKLYFFSGRDCQHSRDLEVNATSAVAIYPETNDWRVIRGLQMRGQAWNILPGAEWSYAWGLYQEKFSFVRDLTRIVKDNMLYVFTPEWIRLVDNREGFGYKKEWSMSDHSRRIQGNYE